MIDLLSLWPVVLVVSAIALLLLLARRARPTGNDPPVPDDLGAFVREPLDGDDVLDD